ncbi:hypothetical protein SAMN04488104_104017 [Algoriphagus faecimaris]|uniref:Uncharacterized protein n=1 Tax=Algoriphagus faecimaris TaxID=686796 RepID=A0A1G6W1Z4_9BACT|nr:hypothetical protein [Algoriphagus faecimaris]SDD59798.1 hypothetical protein SAMN04488104_104017 [Algoriphagus faecimaris]
MMIRVLYSFLVFKFSFLLFSSLVYSQEIYRDDQGREIGKAYFEKQILEGPYFGIPGQSANEKVLVHRMPSGKLEDTRVFFEKTGSLEAYEEGKSLLIVFYPGPDECNTTAQRNPQEYYSKNHKALLRWTGKLNAADPVYIYASPVGLQVSSSELTWNSDPESIFQQQFFRFPYPCQSFMVLHPDGRYRGILGEFPLDQIQVALKKIKRGK